MLHFSGLSFHSDSFLNTLNQSRYLIPYGLVGVIFLVLIISCSHEALGDDLQSIIHVKEESFIQTHLRGGKCCCALLRQTISPHSLSFGRAFALRIVKCIPVASKTGELV